MRRVVFATPRHRSGCIGEGAAQLLRYLRHPDFITAIRLLLQRRVRYAYALARKRGAVCIASAYLRARK